MRYIYILSFVILCGIPFIHVTAQGYFTPVTNFFTDITSSANNVPLPPAVPTNPLISIADADNCYNGFCKDTSPSCSVSLFFTRELKEGDSGIDVVALQNFLISERYLKLSTGQIKGYFGPATSKAIQKYQQEEGLSVSGYLDTSLVNSLNESVTSGDRCLLYVRYDALTLTPKKNLNLSSLVKQFNSYGIVGEDEMPFCTKNSKSSTCINVFNYKPFTLYLPKNISVTKTASYLQSRKAFDRILYVPVTEDVEFDLPELFVKSVAKTETSTTTSNVIVTNSVASAPEYSSTSTVTYVEFQIPSGMLGSNPTQVDVNRAIISLKPDPDEYIYGTWKLQKINDAPLNQPFGQKAILLSITKDNGGRIKIDACNTVSSDASIYGNTVWARSFPAADMYCNAIHDSSEKVLKEAFASTVNYDIGGTTYGNATLTITNAVNKQKFDFVRN